MKRRGFSAVEALLACALFSLSGLCLFLLLQFGFRAFSLGSQRMGAQAEAETILTRLRSDLESTTVASLRTQEGGGRTIVVPLSVGPTNQPRHLLCCCGLTDWGDRNAYDLGSGCRNGTATWSTMPTSLPRAVSIDWNSTQRPTSTMKDGRNLPTIAPPFPMLHRCWEPPYLPLALPVGSG